jgi:hypothetical protein
MSEDRRAFLSRVRVALYLRCRAATLTRLLRSRLLPSKGEVMCAPPPLHLDPCGRGRARQRAGEGGNTALCQESKEAPSINFEGALWTIGTVQEPEPPTQVAAFCGVQTSRPV